MSATTTVFSPCRTYRYVLIRSTSELAGRGFVNFVLLNPSTADEYRDDPTIRRCLGFARTWGYAHVAITNLYAFRSTDPLRLLEVDDPVGPKNDQHIGYIAGQSDLVVAGWGAWPAAVPRAAAVRALVSERGRVLHHIGLTNNGQPRHPLYVRATARPEPL